ncbi:MAG: hypothetical protein IMZ53_05340, partial [Thermoplasmata archaeon]|nr:hypothetical protein [Thermoplasmata archaeon]
AVGISNTATIKNLTVGTGITAGIPLLITGKLGTTVASIDSSGNIVGVAGTFSGAVSGTTIGGTTATLRIANLGAGNTTEQHPLAVGGTLLADANRFTVDSLGNASAVNQTITGTLTGSAVIRDTNSFSGTGVTKAIYISGATSSDIYFISKRIIQGVSTDALVDTMALGYMAKPDSLIVIRPVTSPSGSKFSWFRVK